MAGGAQGDAKVGGVAFVGAGAQGVELWGIGLDVVGVVGVAGQGVGAASEAGLGLDEGVVGFEGVTHHLEAGFPRSVLQGLVGHRNRGRCSRRLWWGTPGRLRLFRRERRLRLCRRRRCSWGRWPGGPLGASSLQASGEGSKEAEDGVPGEHVDFFVLLVADAVPVDDQFVAGGQVEDGVAVFFRDFFHEDFGGYGVHDFILLGGRVQW